MLGPYQLAETLIQIEEILIILLVDVSYPRNFYSFLEQLNAVNLNFVPDMTSQITQDAAKNPAIPMKFIFRNFSGNILNDIGCQICLILYLLMFHGMMIIIMRLLPNTNKYLINATKILGANTAFHLSLGYFVPCIISITLTFNFPFVQDWQARFNYFLAISLVLYYFGIILTTLIAYSKIQRALKFTCLDGYFK